MPTISAADNPELANQLLQSVLEDTAPPDPEDEMGIVVPPDTVFRLPGGYATVDGHTHYEIEVRELTGRDEEAIARCKTAAAMTEQVLRRGIVRVGGLKADDTVLNGMLSGDRDFALLRIFAATFGATVKINYFCGSCSSDIELSIDVDKDVPVRSLEDSADRYFEVDCRSGVAKVMLPTGVTQKAIQEASTKTYSELSTILLRNTVVQVGNRDIFTEQDVLDLPIRDRRKISEELSNRNPGPRLGDVTKECPNCDAVMEVPLSLSALFQF